jgi:hypothetical protein
MTDFFMRYCKKSLSALLCGLLLACVLSATAQAEGITVNKTEFRIGEEGYQLSASYDISLNFVIKQALSRGIPIYFVGEFSLTQPRWGWLDATQQALSRGMQSVFSSSPMTRWSWLDKDIFEGEQTVKLSYSVLTGRYRISRGALYQNFASLEDALNMLSRQSSTAIPEDLIKKDEKYIAAARLRLDIEQLPKPLQVNALTDSDWTLDSGWYRWPVNAVEVPAKSDRQAE